MKPALSRLVLVAGLFVAWLFYLGYLVLTAPRHNRLPLVVSRPQVVASEIDIIAFVEDPARKVKVKRVLRSKNSAVRLEPDQEISVEFLKDCRPVTPTDAPDDFSRPGEYLIPLKQWHGGFMVADIPPSPGFFGGVRRIYPATPEALAQYARIQKPGDE